MMVRSKSCMESINGRETTTRPDGEALNGLLVRGTVTRRWRKVLDTGVEVVYYEIDKVTVHVYRTDGDYFAIGQQVEIAVSVSCYQSKQGVRYSLVQKTDKVDGEF